jgi:hypothetical protein
MKRIELLPIDSPLWSKYCRDYEYLQGKTVYINRFIARYSLAKAFKGIDAHTFRRSTLMGYDAVMRLMLAFSAYDTLFKAVEKLTPQLSLRYDIYSFLIHNHELEEEFRSNQLLLNVLKADAKETALSRLEAFEKGGESLTCIAFAIRNMVAHGQMNPTASKASRTSVANQINQLSALVLDACDFIFNDYLIVLIQVLDDPIKADFTSIEKENKELLKQQRWILQQREREAKKTLRKQLNSVSHAIG